MPAFMLACAAVMSILQLSTAIDSELAFPHWLSEISGLTEWPGRNAPYIALPNVNLNKTRPVPLRDQWKCDNVLPEYCSFDCGHCVLATDVYSCSPMSQTFDDGPTEATVELLDGLKKTRTKSTFFLIGMNIIDWPEIVRRQHREKHHLAVHTWSHKFLPSLSSEEVMAELQWCIWAINATLGVVPRYFRPPYGGLDNRVRDIAAKLNLVPVLWDHDTDDWRLNEGTRTASQVLHELNHWTSESAPPRKSWSYFRSPKAKGLLLEHDLSRANVQLALTINNKIKSKQKTVAQCVNQNPYL